MDVNRRQGAEAEGPEGDGSGLKLACKSKTEISSAPAQARHNPGRSNHRLEAV